MRESDHGDVCSMRRSVGFEHHYASLSCRHRGHRALQSHIQRLGKVFGCALEATEHERLTTAVIFTFEVCVRSQDVCVDGVFLRDECVQSPRPLGVARGPSVLVEPLLD